MKYTVLLHLSRLLPTLAGKVLRSPLRGTIWLVLLSLFAGPNLFGQDKLSDPEGYKLRFEGQFWHSSPTATVSGSSAQAPISFDKTFGFTDYSTYVFNIDWHFATHSQFGPPGMQQVWRVQGI